MALHRAVNKMMKDGKISIPITKLKVCAKCVHQPSKVRGLPHTRGGVGIEGVKMRLNR